LADWLFTPSVDGDENLRCENIAPDKIHCVGNVMIDTLVRLLPKAEQSRVGADLGLSPAHPYALVTLHRPSNVDEPAQLAAIMSALDQISRSLTVVFPVHPRTLARLNELNLMPSAPQIRLVEPLGYLDFLALEQRAQVVITDSGGVQEETTFLGVPCLTLRENTERPITVHLGTNSLIGHDMARLQQEIDHILAGRPKRGQVPPLWDGHAADRIARLITASEA